MGGDPRELLRESVRKGGRGREAEEGRQRTGGRGREEGRRPIKGYHRAEAPPWGSWSSVLPGNLGAGAEPRAQSHPDEELRRM